MSVKTWWQIVYDLTDDQAAKIEAATILVGEAIGQEVDPGLVAKAALERRKRGPLRAEQIDALQETWRQLPSYCAKATEADHGCN